MQYQNYSKKIRFTERYIPMEMSQEKKYGYDSQCTHVDNERHEGLNKKKMVKTSRINKD